MGRSRRQGARRSFTLPGLLEVPSPPPAEAGARARTPRPACSWKPSGTPLQPGALKDCLAIRKQQQQRKQNLRSGEKRPSAHPTAQASGPPRCQQRGPPRGSASLGAWGGATLPRARVLPFPCGLPPGPPPGSGALGPGRPQASSSCEGPRGARQGATALALRGCGVSGAASAREGRGGAEPEAGKTGRRPSPREPPV